MNNFEKSLESLDLAADKLLLKSKKKEEELSAEDITEYDLTKELEKDEDKDKSKDKDKDKDKSETVEDAEEEETDEEDTNKTEEEEEEETDEDISKSFADNSSISNAMEVSEFLSALVEVTANSISNLQKSVDSSMNNTDLYIGTLAKSFNSIAKSQEVILENQDNLSTLYKSLKDNLDIINERMSEIESQPMARKSVNNIKVMNKDFQKSLGGEGEQLSKSEVLNVLNQELYSGNPMVSPSDIISVESGAPLRRELQQLVQSKVTQF